MLQSRLHDRIIDVNSFRKDGSVATVAHRYIQFESDRPPEGVVRELTIALLNHYASKEKSRAYWKKHPQFTLNWKQPLHDLAGAPAGQKARQSAPLTLKIIESHLSDSGTFNYESLGLPEPGSPWLDVGVDFAPNFHAPATDGSAKALKIVAGAPYGPKFPFHPALDREGRSLSSFQGLLLKRVGSLRRSLVSTSFTPWDDSWFQDFRTLISECVSLVDATLHQLYFKAEYDPLPGWVFDRNKLGERHGQRLADKLGWVYQITRRFLNARDEKAAFVAIKDLRNHLQHFDPPTFCYSIEDAVRWLNQVQLCGRLNWEIRKTAGAGPSVPLIEFLVQPSARFVAADPSRRRIPQPLDTGYGSTNAALPPKSTTEVNHGPEPTFDMPPNANIVFRRP